MATYETRINYTIDSQSIENNTSTVTLTFQARRTDYPFDGYNSTGDAYWQISFAGKSSGKKYFNFSKNVGQNVWFTIATWKTTVTHSADGSFKGTAEAYTYLGISPNSFSASRSITLTTIPRKTDITAVTATMGDTITIDLNRKASGFTHALEYAFGNATDTIATGAGTSASWTVPKALANQLPNATSGVGTITCKTYNGSTLIGTSTAKLTLKVSSDMIPSLTGITVEEAVASVKALGIYVQGKSKLKLTMTGVAGSYGSTIKSYVITVAGQTIYAVSGTTNVINTSGNLTITATITDSRGRSASRTMTIAVLPYSPPKLTSYSATRQNPASNVLVVASGSITSLKNVSTEKNALIYVIKYKLMISSSYTSVTVQSGGLSFANLQKTLADIDATKTYDMQLVISDYFTTVTYSLQIPTTDVIEDRKKTGFAIGKYSEVLEAFEVAWKSIFYSDIEVRGNVVGQLKRAGVSSSWYAGRDKAMIRQNSITGYSPFASIKTTNGTWEIGAYDNGSFLDHLTFSYVKDSDFNAGSNVSKIVSIGPDGVIHGTVEKASYLVDRTNGNAEYLNYGAAAVTTATYLAAWNGYELRAITPASVRTVIGAAATSHTHNYAANGRRIKLLWSGSVNAGGSLTLNETIDHFNFLVIIDGTSSGAYATPIICPVGHGATTLRGMGGYEKSSGIEEHNIAATASGTSVKIDHIGSRTYTSSGIQAYQYLYAKRIYGVW